MDRYEMIKS